MAQSIIEKKASPTEVTNAVNAAKPTFSFNYVESSSITFPANSAPAAVNIIIESSGRKPIAVAGYNTHDPSIIPMIIMFTTVDGQAAVQVKARNVSSGQITTTISVLVLCVSDNVDVAAL